MPQKINFTNAEIDTIINLYDSHISCKEIGKQFNCSKQTINKLLKNNNILIKDCSHAQQKYQINENIFENIDSHEKAYWLGMLAGDGWVTNKNELGLSLQIKDKNHIYKFRDFLQSNHPINIIYNRPKKDGSPSISYSLVINNKKIVNDLQQYGIKPNKTLHMSFPNLPEELLPNYMLGLIDSDGCFCLKSKYNNKDIKLLNFSFVGPKEFVEKFQQILIQKCDISVTKLDIRKNTNFIRIVNYGGYKNIYKIVKFLYSKPIVYMFRKHKIAIDYLLTKYPEDTWLISQLNNPTST